MNYELWVDFNMVNNGRVVTLIEFARPDVDVAAGRRLLVGDREGNVCDATVEAVHQDGTVELAVHLASFKHGHTHTAATVG